MLVKSVRDNDPGYVLAGVRPNEAPQQFADDAKLRLIAAAEALYAVRSIESVSLREIAQAAGHANTNAVQYHFGGRDALVQAIFAWRVWQMEPVRGAMLADAEARGQGNDLRALVRVLCEPILELVDETGRHTYAAFMSKYLLQQRPAGLMHAAENRPDISTNLRLTMRRILALIRSASETEDYRIALAYMVVTNMLVVWDNEGVRHDDPLLRERYEVALAMAVAALEAGSGPV